MTREEAKHRLLNIERCTPIHTREDARDFEALEMAIQALEKENIYDDKEHYVTISKALYDKLNIDYEQALEQEPCEDWYDVPSNDMTLEQARQAVKDLRKKLAEYLGQEPCEDTVSREAVMRLIENKPYDWSNLTERHNMLMEIRKLPSVTQKQKSGKWIPTNDISKWGYKCSECEGIDDTYLGHFCKWCGAKMVEPQESEE